MALKRFVTDLIASYEQKKQQSGNDSVTCDSVIEHLNTILQSPVDERYEGYEAAQAQSDLEMFKSVIEAGLNAVKSAMLLNGGASIAMLAFIGHLAETRPNSIAILAPTLVPFAIGTFFTVLTSGGRYLSQALYAHDQIVWGHRFRNLCIGLSLASYVLFLVGVVVVYFKLLRL